MTTPDEKRYIPVYHPFTYQWIGMHEMKKKEKRSRIL